MNQKNKNILFSNIKYNVINNKKNYKFNGI